MSNPFFEHPILNSPYACPQRHWELDGDGQPTQQIIEERRKAEFISPIPRPKKRKAASAQQQFVFDEGKGLSTEKQQYDTTTYRASGARRRTVPPRSKTDASLFSATLTNRPATRSHAPTPC
jgi:hypothetical protein